MVARPPIYTRYYDLFAPASRCRGLPIGSLTSQLFANLYLSRIDHLILEELKPAGYARYTDDLLIFSDSKTFLHEAKARLFAEFAMERLKPHPTKCRIHACREGVPFLGFRYYPDRVRVLQSNRRRFEKRMRNMRKQWKEGLIELGDIWKAMFGWFQHIRTYPVNEGLVRAECRAQVF